jgi:small-conductance mechanosensitive channel
MELRALDAHLRERLRVVGGATASLGELARTLVADVDRIDREAARWPERSRIAREAQAPAEIQLGVDAVAPEMTALRAQLVERRDRVLVAYERALRTQSRLESLRAAVAERRERLWQSLRTSIGEPVWKGGAVGHPLGELRANAELMRYDLVRYLARFGERLAWTFAAMAAAVLVLLRRPTIAPTPSAAVKVCAALAVAVALLALIAPQPAPLAFYRLLWFAFPLFAAVVAAGTFARGMRATVWGVAIAAFVNQFRVAAEMSPAGDWLLLALQVLVPAAALVRDWRRGGLGRALPRVPAAVLRRLVYAELAVVLVALVASAAGHAGLAAVLVAYAVIAPAFAFGFAAIAWSLDRALTGLLTLPIAQALRSVREQREAILRTLHRVVVAAAWAGGIALFALSYSALDDIERVAGSLGKLGLRAGDVAITVDAVASALAVVVLTWIATKLVRFVLEHEILPRLDLRAGVPVAISTVVAYVLVVVGAVLAMAALGVDLTKVTLLAGALGIGVGLGLQNVVNNFASGLILMVERPVNVGDQIDLGGVVGEVRRIGVRSSTIRTLQGAEIIVPNADLASKQVTNWTLSDRSRRYEIDVGVAYGSDPAQVLRLLEGAAASVPEVQRAPAPRALFVGFGPSSLDFRVFAWVVSVDVGLDAQNGLRTAILRALADAHIEIPFPQSDVHIRQAADAVSSPPPRKTVSASR